MRRAFETLICVSITLLSAARGECQAQPSSIAFRNETKIAVIIQGTSTVGGMIRRGQPIVVAPGQVVGEFNVPPGARVYSAYDAKTPSKVLALDVPFTIPPGANILISVRQLPNNTIGLVPEAAKR
jgi:hypothetical protein